MPTLAAEPQRRESEPSAESRPPVEAAELPAEAGPTPEAKPGVPKSRLSPLGKVVERATPWLYPHPLISRPLGVLDGIVQGEAAWTSRGDLEAHGHPPWAIDELIRDGLLGEWRFDDATMLVLTPLALERYRLLIVESGLAQARRGRATREDRQGRDLPRYGRALPRDDRERAAWGLEPSALPSWGGLPEPPAAVRASPVEGQVAWSDYLEITRADPSPGPEQRAIEAEEAAKRFVVQQVVDEEGRLKIDPATGAAIMEAVTLLGQQIPIDPRLGKGAKPRSWAAPKKGKGAKAKKSRREAAA